MRSQSSYVRPLRQRQAGVVLIIALIVMVAMIMASVALVRSVDITTQIAGNLAFRQAGVQAADSGVETAIKFLKTPGLNLTGDIPPSYYSTWNGGIAPTKKPAIFDPLDFDWTGKSELPEEAAGNTVSYVVHRMCQLPGDPSDPTKNCYTAPTSASGESKRVKDATEFQCTGTNCVASNAPYFRITSRVVGPRSTVTYIQAVIY